MIDEILKLRAVVTLQNPANGYWDGGPKSQFEFTPEVERTPGPAAVRWGSFAANIWFVLPVGKSVKSHVSALRRKLRGNAPRRITVK